MKTRTSMRALCVLLSCTLICFISTAPAQSVTSPERTQELVPPPSPLRISVAVRTGFSNFSMSETFAYLDALKAFPRPSGVSSDTETENRLPLCFDLDLRFRGSFSIWAEGLIGLSSERTVNDETWKASSKAFYAGGKLYQDFSNGFLYGRAGLGLSFHSLEVPGYGMTGPSPIGGLSSPVLTVQEFTGKTLSFTLGAGGGTYVTQQLSLNAEVTYRTAKVEKVEDDLGSTIQWKEERTSFSHSISQATSNSELPGYKLVPVDFTSLQFTVGLSFHFSM